MRGHEPILAMRREGAAPASIWLHDMAGYTPDTAGRMAWPLHSARADVEVLHTDSPRRLDLRFCVGLVVHVNSDSSTRLQGLIDTAVACGAQRVIGSRINLGRVVSVTDTAGHFAWSA